MNSCSPAVARVFFKAAESLVFILAIGAVPQAVAYKGERNALFRDFTSEAEGVFARRVL